MDADAKEGQVLTLQAAITQVGAVQEECRKAVVTIMDALGLPTADKPDAEGPSKGESTLTDRIGEVNVLQNVSRIILDDLGRVKSELRLL